MCHTACKLPWLLKSILLERALQEFNVSIQHLDLGFEPFLLLAQRCREREAHADVVSPVHLSLLAPCFRVTQLSLDFRLGHELFRSMLCRHLYLQITPAGFHRLPAVGRGTGQIFYNKVIYIDFQVCQDTLIFLYEVTKLSSCC